MAQYKVRNRKNDDGTYTLSYGKGKQKLTATMAKGSDGWSITDDNDLDPGVFRTMKECKAAWGAWAEDAYGNESGSKAESETPPDQQSPKLPSTPGPPSFKRPAPSHGPVPQSHRRTVPAKSGEPLGREFNANPFDPRFKAANKELSPLGVLVEIASWGTRNTDEIKKFEKKLYPQTPITVLLEQVHHTLKRECPDLFTGDDDVQTEEDKPLKPAATTAAPPPPPAFSRPKPNSAAAVLAETDDDDIPF